MQFSEQWLREWVSPDIDTDTLVAQLTMAGLEVDGVNSASGEFSGVIVAEVTDVKPHPMLTSSVFAKLIQGLKRSRWFVVPQM